MAFPLLTVLGAAPGLISAATELIRVIRKRKSGTQTPEPETDRIAELESLLEKQAQLIEELAVNNRNLALAVRNNRLIAGAALLLALLVSGWLFFNL
jgi:uncharacterized coiled-coil protein SlyX